MVVGSSPTLPSMDRIEALNQLKERKSNQPKKIDNGQLYAGMYFYCRICGHLCDTLPESYVTKPREYCKECQTLIDKGWVSRELA